MQIKVQTTFNIDIAAERRRLEKAFGDELSDAKARQFALLDAFESRDWKLFTKLYDELPQYYCEEEGCDELEFVGEAIVEFLEYLLYSKYDTRIVNDD